MKVTFQRVDDEYFGVEKYVRPVVEIAIKNNIFVHHSSFVFSSILK